MTLIRFTAAALLCAAMVGCASQKPAPPNSGNIVLRPDPAVFNFPLN